MAYLDLLSGANVLPAGFSRPEVRQRRGLDTAERGAVMLARSDRKDSLRAPTRLHRLSQACFGLPRRPNALADQRLESLRRYAVALAHDSEESAAREREQLVLLGYSEHQIFLAAGIAMRFQPRPRRGLWAFLLLPFIATGAFLWADQLLEDHMMSFVLAMTITTPIIALVVPRTAH